jgi:hypothetical protein
MELDQAIFFLLGLPVFSISFLIGGMFLAKEINH